jgi:hypothetical protein
MQIPPASPRKTEAIMTAATPFIARSAAMVVEEIHLGGPPAERSR